MKKKILAVLLSTMMVLSMVACGGSEEAAEETTTTTEEAGSGEAYHFEVIVKSFQSTYWQAAVTGIENACAELGVTANANGPANESDIADQVQMIDSAIEQAPDGLGLAACDTEAVIPSLTKALEAGIPVVCFDTGVDNAPEGSVYATVATDNVAAGACAAENMFPVIEAKITAATVDAPVRIGEVNQDATALNIQQRGQGFIDKMIELCNAAGKQVAVVGNEFYVNNTEGAVAEGEAEVIIEVAVPAQTTVDLAATEAQKILSKDDTIAIFGSNQTTAEGVITANQTLNVLNADPEKGIVAAGFDAGTPQKEAIVAGQLIGSVTQSPLMMGYECIYTLYDICEGNEVADIPMDGYWYNTENMEDENIAPNLYD
ncbi:MAG: substrate-binding domain-containing protein [Ruminococcus sp.]|nr:substrate-binding domain-containing protein [Ruminococcus sp.]